MKRVGVASITQETNTFARGTTTLDDFTASGLWQGDAIVRQLAGTNTEVAGALAALDEHGVEPVPLLAAFAPPGPRLSASAFDALWRALDAELERAGQVDGVILALHGAMAAVGLDDADGEILARARARVGPGCPVAVCLDLHANVTARLIREAALVVAYRTHPHVDQAATGARAAAMLVDALVGRSRPVTVVSKRPMLLAAEVTNTDEGLLRALRVEADAACQGAILDVSLFPVQPWLDVDELGFAVTVTADGDAESARSVAEHVADAAWRRRHEAHVELYSPKRAIDSVRGSGSRPVILAQSADSTSAGAAGDSAALIHCLLTEGRDLFAIATLIDRPAVATCFVQGLGARVSLTVGGTIDRRYSEPLSLDGVVARLDDGRFSLEGPVNRGLPVNCGRRAVVRSGRLDLLLTERSAYTYDPAAYRSAGLDPSRADAVHVRSASLFRAGWSEITESALFVDTPGASTPDFRRLRYHRAPRPLHPLDAA